MMWVYCLGVCRPELPGLAGVIVLTLRHAAAATGQFHHPNINNVRPTNTQGVKEN